MYLCIVKIKKIKTTNENSNVNFNNHSCDDFDEP